MLSRKAWASANNAFALARVAADFHILMYARQQAACWDTESAELSMTR